MIGFDNRKCLLGGGVESRHALSVRHPPSRFTEGNEPKSQRPLTRGQQSSEIVGVAPDPPNAVHLWAED